MSERMVEEYQHGSDYAPIFEKMFEQGIKKTKLSKDGKTYSASYAKECEWICMLTGKSWLHATREWFADNGYEEAEK